jgi:exodeoxyribonuclease-1
MRLAHALRPDGIIWPQREDGAASFKLEHLALANGVREGEAHEALSDVYATVGMARKFRDAQPRLWDYALKLRDKRYAAQLLDTIRMTPVLHVSQRFPANRLCAAPVLPLARNPRIDGRVIVFDLGQDPEPLLSLDAEQIRNRLYTPAAELAEGEFRIALKEVHLNRCPALVAWDHLREADLRRLRIDPAIVEERAARLREVGPALAEKVRRVFVDDRERRASAADASLYDGFIGDGDKRLWGEVRATPPQALATRPVGFRDPRLQVAIGGRCLRRQRFGADSGLSEYGFDSFRAELQLLRGLHVDDSARLALLDQLEAWGDTIESSLQ